MNPNSGNPNPNALTDDDLKALANADLTAKRFRDDQGGKQVRLFYNNNLLTQCVTEYTHQICATHASVYKVYGNIT